MKRFVMTVALTCVLSSSALAGEVPTVGVTAPPPAETSIPTAPGDIPTVGFAQQMSEAALTLIESVLGAVI